VRLIFGKSLVGGTGTSDIFDSITPGSIPYAKPRGYEPPEQKLAFELGGPWAFYHAFWPAHDIQHLNDLYPPEAQVAGKKLWVPLIIRNDTDSPKQVELHSVLPQGWNQYPSTVIYPVAAHDSYPLQLTITPPQSATESWQTLSWSATSNGKTIGEVKLRVNTASNYLPQ
jgi:hypothetical protein